MDKPELFIGSSSEGLDFARAVRGRLYADADVQLWDESFFKPTKTVVETLFKSLKRFDFAVLILTPDDLVMTREREAFVPRDNVLFELGLYMGHLGRDRTFLVHETNHKIKLLSDLDGVTKLGYEWPNSDFNHERAVGRACSSTRREIRKQGKAVREPLSWINELSQLLLNKYERAALRALNSPILLSLTPQHVRRLSRDYDASLTLGWRSAKRQRRSPPSLTEALRVKSRTFWLSRKEEESTYMCMRRQNRDWRRSRSNSDEWNCAEVFF